MKRGIAVVVAALLLAAAGLWYFRDRPSLTLVAEFAQADGVYPGNKVTVLGVETGTVVATEPRGGTVRVTMSLPAGTKIPPDAHAWVVTPAVISEKYVELDPPFRGGEPAGDGTVIPVERTHAPLAWDDLVRSLDTLLVAAGDGSLGQAVHNGANALDGNGAKLRDAVHDISQASELLAGHSGDLTGLLGSLDRLVAVLGEHKSTVDSLSGSVSQAAELFGAQRGTISASVTQLAEALRQVSGLIEQHGQPLTGDLARLSELSTTILAHQGQLTEILDTAPLAFDNFGRAVTPDGRLRIRLNISTNLSQLPGAYELCRQYPIPLCSGAGIVNPIPFPPGAVDGLGLNSVLGGG
ncbi:MCE family protein [Amycolatopsis albispora]|uniref:MCE family protein n=1 Tax=Amycolatopsis albispora TaxID=1804986 RepID=UPI001F3687C9|nr:MCE family protein [Amycolatopsis albispora]